jgi:hypothetical protein
MPESCQSANLRIWKNVASARLPLRRRASSVSWMVVGDSTEIGGDIQQKQGMMLPHLKERSERLPTASNNHPAHAGRSPTKRILSAMPTAKLWRPGRGGIAFTRPCLALKHTCTQRILAVLIAIQAGLQRPQWPLSSTSVSWPMLDFLVPGVGLIVTVTSDRQLTSPQSRQRKCG